MPALDRIGRGLAAAPTPPSRRLELTEVWTDAAFDFGGQLLRRHVRAHHVVVREWAPPIPPPGAASLVGRAVAGTLRASRPGGTPTLVTAGLVAAAWTLGRVAAGQGNRPALPPRLAEASRSLRRGVRRRLDARRSDRRPPDELPPAS